MARSVECRCDSGFTCGYCLRNAKPWFFTGASGAGSYQVPADLSQPGLLQRERLLAYRAACEKKEAE